ncbi:hypothetical protein R1sor_014550 [Riccia sorocarpa]|uniref:Translation initiation factor IF-3 n=1 Tax=Riccia sorocarpa TaxID=122646 RepID=A0ABD3HDY9_9MARC
MALVEAISFARVHTGSSASIGLAGLECREFRSRSQLMGVAVERNVAFGRVKDVNGGRGLAVVSRMGGSSAGSGPPRPRLTFSGRRGPSQQQEANSSDGPLMNQDIRVPQVRLLDEESNMVGLVATGEALQRARDADLDLVMISPDADPPVVRIMDYSKYRYEQQKKKREAQKKAAASRQELKELKMRYNIDTHDYAVRLRAAQRFLKDGDKVKVVCQFKGRELDFKELAVKLFERFQDEIGEAAIVEQKITFEGKSMMMVLTPNKAVAQKEKAVKEQAAAKNKAQGGNKSESAESVEVEV